jgi:hypothetical protein
MIESIDFYFPFIIFAYGIILIFLTEIPLILKFAKQKMPHYHQQFIQHRVFGLVAFFVGGLWSAQNLFLL